MIEEARYVAKAVIVGDYSVGKTSLVRRFVEGTFEHDYKPSIGVNITMKVVDAGGMKLKFNLFDAGGQERFEPIRKKYYRGTQAVIYVFDITRAESAVSIEKRWMVEVEAVIGRDYARIVLANKADLPQREVSEYAGRQVAERINAAYYETSALDGRNVNEAFTELAAIILRKHFSEG
ncbi:MAG: Rab family GTPase [Promethearchaeota archaeon]